MKSLVRSTSFKLVVFFVIACTAVILIVQQASNLISDYSAKKVYVRHLNRVQYALLLAQKLEASHDEARDIVRFHKQLTIGIQVKDLHGVTEYTTPDVSTDWYRIERQAVRLVWTPDAKTGEYNHIPFAMITLHQHRYLFFFRYAPFQQLQMQWVPLMTAVILLIFFAYFLFVRWVFAPVAWLSDGIRRLGRGDFDVSVPLRAHDEFGDLAHDFNETVVKVRHIMNSKKQLLLDVSHELRTPLTRIQLALELESAKAKEHIRRNVLVLESMIQDLLESARLESRHRALQVEPFDLTELVFALVSAFKGQPPGIRAEGFSKSYILRADRGQVETCLSNVLDNAIKYSNQQSQPVEIRIEDLGSEGLKVSVRDFGIGIPKDEQDFIFEPFYRIDKSRARSTRGYGLGLSMCRKIMLAHGGQISVCSPMPNGGSTFVLEFPSLDVRAESPAREHSC